MKKEVKKKRKKGMSKRQKRQMALLTLVVLIASVVAIMLLTPFFNITQIRVSGNMHISGEDIIRYSGIKENVNTFSIDLEKAEKNILGAESRIASVNIKRELPNKITIKVVEEIEVAYLTAEGGYIKITADGRCIEVTDGTTTSESGGNIVAVPTGIPKIAGMNSVKYKMGKTITSENEKQLEDLLKCLREFTKQGYIFDMVEIDVSDTENIKFYYLSRDLCVTVGNTDNLEYKIQCFGQIYKTHVLKNTKEGKMPSGYINLKYDDHMTYRPKEETPVVSDPNATGAQ